MAARLASVWCGAARAHLCTSSCVCVCVKACPGILLYSSERYTACVKALSGSRHLSSGVREWRMGRCTTEYRGDLLLAPGLVGVHDPAVDAAAVTVLATLLTSTAARALLRLADAVAAEAVGVSSEVARPAAPGTTLALARGLAEAAGGRVEPLLPRVHRRLGRIPHWRRAVVARLRGVCGRRP